jgi:hypothetical protein
MSDDDATTAAHMSDHDVSPWLECMRMNLKSYLRRKAHERRQD